MQKGLMYSMEDQHNHIQYQFYLRSVVHAMKQMLDNKLLPYDITNQQAHLLGYLDAQLKSREEIVQKDLESAMKLRGPSITSLLQGLERKGFIVRNTGNEDGRTKKVQITDKGEALISEVESSFMELEKMLVDGLSEKEKADYLRMLKISYNNLNIE
jgi:Transcriptional regulators